MVILSKVILIAAIVWTIWRIVRIRRQVRNGDIMIPPFIASTLVFALFVVLIAATGFSPFHLLWLFPLSLVLGIVSLLSPFVTKLVMGFLVMLANPERDDDT